LYSAIPALMAVLFVGYSVHRVNDLNKDLRDLTRELDQKRHELEVIQGRLDEASSLDRYLYPINLVQVKNLAVYSARAAALLETILKLRDKGLAWHLGGRTPEQGFDSPGFVVYVLRLQNLPGGSLERATSEYLLQNLPEVADPDTGDLVFYEGGYVLFYFQAYQGDPFVIGMTPFGIVPLRNDFAKIIGYRHVLH
jgi:hypothetical protein